MSVHLLAQVLAALLCYEIVRFFVVRAVRRSAERRVSRYRVDRRIRIDRYKLANRSYVRAEILDDPTVQAAILEAAKEKGSVEDVRRTVEAYVEEIVPAFNFVSYYQLARRFARFATNLVYDVSADRASMLRAASSLREHDVVVFVSNHRSNADYVTLARVLMRQTSISYAVGEWARVWPLDSIFRSFGAFFVRRGFPDPLYHAVLRRYVQLSARRGVTQGIFPEGGLSRDGKLRPPKVGLLTSLALLLSDPDFRGDVVLVPVGVNYDRVLEDTSLLAERDGGSPPSARDRLSSLARLIVRGPVVVVDNGVRLLTGRLRRHGVAAVGFGAPVSLRALLAADARERADEPWARSLGPTVMRAIGGVVPVTPVTITCLALAQADGPITRDTLRGRVRALADRLHEAGAPFARVPRLRALRRVRATLEHERAERDRRREMLEMEEEMLGWDEAEGLMDLALEMLARRRIVRVTGEVVEVAAARRDLVAYYANSLAHYAG